MTKYDPGVDTDVDHNLVLSFWDHSKPFSEAKVFEARILPRDIPDLIRNVSSQGLIALSAVASDVAFGDCPTCLNRRLVDITLPHGGKSNTYCPDCRPEGREWVTPFAEYPLLGGGLAPREED